MSGIIVPGDRVILRSPTPTLTDSSRIAATTQFLKAEIDTKAETESPIFTGTPTASTPSAFDVSDRIATMKYVSDVLSGIFPPITSPNISAPAIVASRSKMNQLIISGSVSHRTPYVRYSIVNTSGMSMIFDKMTDIIDGQIVYFEARTASRDTVVTFRVTPTDGVLVGAPVNVSVLVKQFTG